MDVDSPLRFLDSDASRYLYETYFPVERDRIAYNGVISTLNKYVKKLVHTEFCSHFPLTGTSAWLKRTGPDSISVRGVLWLWHRISAAGSPINTSRFQIQDNGDGTGVFQEHGIRWEALSFPPQVDNYFTGNKFIAFLKESPWPWGRGGVVSPSRPPVQYVDQLFIQRYSDNLRPRDESLRQRCRIANMERPGAIQVGQRDESLTQRYRIAIMERPGAIQVRTDERNASHRVIKKRWRRFARNLWKAHYIL